MATTPAAPGLVLCLAAMILLIFVSVSVPVWDKISFLDTKVQGKTIKFGIWGYTGSQKKLGYAINGALIGLSNNSLLDSSVLKNLTYILVLHPVAAALSFVSVVFGTCGVFSYSRVGTILMTVVSSLALFVTLVVFSIDMILWNIVRNQIRSDTSGNSATLGNANWLTLGAIIALVMGSCAAGCGSFGRYRHHHRHSHHERY
ncbi:hypothetical protein BS47DRAFT_636268 [Hydnum rufescens UP504]|uniref:Pali-domain-containing protein n=1 Tax=Hydnum rufescens UP504 TaxID=1448309 RepID=A0A9P6E224_9AGAM|nr:hypothetical protein BS47DRAFT_636268 [Hydnum rufescens UP504]